MAYLFKNLMMEYIKNGRCEQECFNEVIYPLVLVLINIYKDFDNGILMLLMITFAKICMGFIKNALQLYAVYTSESVGIGNICVIYIDTIYLVLLSWVLFNAIRTIYYLECRMHEKLPDLYSKIYLNGGKIEKIVLKYTIIPVRTFLTIYKCFEIVKSRKYQGVFEVKSRVKTWQVRGIWSQQLEH